MKGFLIEKVRIELGSMRIFMRVEPLRALTRRVYP